MEKFNPEKIINEVEAKEYGELAELSNTELIEFVNDAYNHIGDTRLDIELALRLLARRGVYRGKLDND